MKNNFIFNKNLEKNLDEFTQLCIAFSSLMNQIYGKKKNQLELKMKIYGNIYLSKGMQGKRTFQWNRQVLLDKLLIYIQQRKRKKNKQKATNIEFIQTNFDSLYKIGKKNNIRKGIVQEKMNITEEILIHQDSAIQQNPEISDNYFNKGSKFALFIAKILQKMKRYDEALIQYDLAIKINPEFSDYYFKKGSKFSLFIANILYKMKRYEEALVQYDLAIKINPELSDYYFKKGYTLSKMNQFEHALIEYNFAIQKKAKISDYYFSKSQNNELVYSNHSLQTESNLRSPYLN
ncbi:unnamed protein product [Paramecium sonneborni]|uniref:Tetratricopeptide repeat protein n=1 Tax=Paramecium sonneborni TaxID=65129 RepID=A0A8S1LU71_9CILI|nr:unnamed protein product [Paramecium sonneborni]